MDPPSPENSSFSPESAIQKLLRGQEATAELQNLLRKLDGDHGSEAADGLLGSIMQSFADTITMLNSAETGWNPLNPSTTRNCLLYSDDHQIIKDPEVSEKIPATTADRRRGYKRRRSSATWTKVSATPFVDEFGWRKYGQKEILGAKFPRSYFRCTHRNDQGCQATKQVQKMEDDPSNYLITYMGTHTCQSISRTPQLVLDSSTSTEPFSLSFESTFIRKSNISFSSFLPIKQEESEEIMKDFPPYNSSAASSSSENPMQSDLSMFESCGPVTKLPMMSPDQGDGFSRSSTSSDSYIQDLKIEPSEFDGLFYLDHEGGFF